MAPDSWPPVAPNAPPSPAGRLFMTRMAPRKFKRKRARVSLTLRLICGYLLRSLLPFLTCIYETLLDVEIYNLYRICVQLCHGRVSIFLVYTAVSTFSRYGRATC